MTIADPVAILVDLVRAPSVTPDAGPALDVVERWLAPAGFAIERPIFGSNGFEAKGTPAVENLFAAIGGGARHLTLAGHVDVVPPGDAAWRHPPFSAHIADGVLFGRGATDMKGGLAAMMAAALRFVEKRAARFDGRLSFLVTGDEEGPAVNGTDALLAWAADRGERFSAAIVGEPTSDATLGDQIKVGRRGSLSATITIDGQQGHAAYPHLAENPMRVLGLLLDALLATPLDAGTERFEPSTLEVIGVGPSGTAWNVIPGTAFVRLNSRYNDRWTRDTLLAELGRRVAAGCEALAKRNARTPRVRIEPEAGNADVFLTRDADLIGLVSEAIRAETGSEPRLSTGGGTSDARFVRRYCPVVEFGPTGRTMHQVDECIDLLELEQCTRVFEGILERFFAV